jgi:general secretion pathway protein L
MTMILNTMVGYFRSWMSSVAASVIAIIGRIRPPRRVRLLEEADGVFKVEIGQGREPAGASAHRVRIENGSIDAALPANLAVALQGSQVELVLQPARFLARPLELPKRATEFLGGIVSAQIDRLTPWSAGDSVFGWTPPTPLGNDRIMLTVVATPREHVVPYLQALVGLGAGSVVVLTVPEGGAATRVRVLEHEVPGVFAMPRIRTALAAIFVVAGLSAGGAMVADQFIADALEAEQQELAQQIAERRASMRREGSTGGTPGQRALERRKQETPASVVVIEALSQVLPDHTYVTELRVEGDKLQVIGVTRDAPSLIRLIEQSPHFTRATFFAPTTRSAGDPGERFHIEARIKPVFSSPT